MKKVLMMLALLGLMAAPVALPLLASAANLPPAGSTIDPGDAGLANDTVSGFAATIIRWLLGIIGVILVGLIVYGGVGYATAAGNEDRAEQGKNILTYAIIGVVIVVIAWIASDYILSALFSGQ